MGAASVATDGSRSTSDRSDVGGTTTAAGNRRPAILSAMSCISPWSKVTDSMRPLKSSEIGLVMADVSSISRVIGVGSACNSSGGVDGSALNTRCYGWDYSGRDSIKKRFVASLRRL